VYFSHIDPFKMISRAFNLLNSLAEGPHLLKKNEFLVLSPESSTLILKEFAQYFKCHPPAKQTDMQFPAVLSIADDAMLDFLPGSAPFDDEGMETSETYLIKKGKMEQKISDINSAFALGQPSTGNGFRLNRAIFPEINFSNLYIKPSVLSLKNLMKRSVNGILVSLIKLKFIELEDYIFSAYGFRYQNDELLEPVHFYFRTNFLSYFLNILNVSKEIKFFYHDYNIGSPYILVKAAALDDHILKI
jgi:predicted Zn-dependent protease